MCDRMKRVLRILPVPGFTEKEARAMSSQARRIHRLRANGQCIACSKPRGAAPSSSFCAFCMKANRERARARNGSVTRYELCRSYVATPKKAALRRKKGETVATSPVVTA